MSALFEYRKVLPVMLILIFLSVVFAWSAMETLVQRVPPGTMRSGLMFSDMADNLRQTSDDLTRMARLYAITGDPLYREYFQEILDIRNGEAPRPEQYYEIPYWDIVLANGERPTAGGVTESIRSLIEAQNLSPEEKGLLAEAEDQSNALAELEFEVMDTVSALSEAAGGEYVLEGDARAAMLRLHDVEYHDAKGKVMAPLIEMAALRDRRMIALADNGRGNLERGFMLMGITLVLSFLLGVGALVRARNRS